MSIYGYNSAIVNGQNLTAGLPLVGAGGSNITTSTGGGGGGNSSTGPSNNTYSSGNGGSGIVKIRYKYQ